MQHAAACPPTYLPLPPFVCLAVYSIWLHVSAPERERGGVKSVEYLVSGARAPGWECRKLAVISALAGNTPPALCQPIDCALPSHASWPHATCHLRRRTSSAGSSHAISSPHFTLEPSLQVDLTRQVPPAPPSAALCPPRRNNFQLPRAINFIDSLTLPAFCCCCCWWWFLVPSWTHQINISFRIMLRSHPATVFAQCRHRLLLLPPTAPFAGACG